MGSATEAGVGLHIMEQKKSVEGCRVQPLLFGLLPTPAASLACLAPPPLCLPCPWQPSPVRRVAQEQVSGGKAQDEEDLLQDHLPAQVTHQIPLGM